MKANSRLTRSFSTACVVAAVVGLFCAPRLTLAQDAISEPAQKTIGATAKKEMRPSLIVMNAHGTSLAGTALNLTGVAPNPILFADRPGINSVFWR